MVAEAPVVAHRRFRLHVVILTVLAVLGAAAAAAWIGAEMISDRRRQQIVDSYLSTRFYEAPMVNRLEAWFEVGDLDVGVLQVRPLADGRIGLRVLLVADGPDGSRGDCCMLVTRPPSETESTPGLRGAPLVFGERMLPTRLEDFMLAVPADAGRTFDVSVVDVGTRDEVGSFTVNLDDLRVPEDLDRYVIPA